MLEFNFKKLTGKNKVEYEQVAKHLVDNCDTELFRLLVEKDDFLFDFVKRNVAKRLDDAVTKDNFGSLVSFLEFYSPSYEDVIAKNLAKYADEDLVDEMLEIFEDGTESEKCYCAKFFSYIQDPLAIDCLRENAWSDNENLALNCAATLGVLQDDLSYTVALEKLRVDDDFEKLRAVKFLTTFGNQDALLPIVDAMMTSSMQENIACEIPYLTNIFELLNRHEQLGLLVINNIINGLGEIIPLYTIFDYELYDVFENILATDLNSKSAIVLLNSIEKFETLTENEEYLFDEDKNTQDEIQDIKALLDGIDKSKLLKFVNEEIKEDSNFVDTALYFCNDAEAIKTLLDVKNQTLILRALESLKNLGYCDSVTKSKARENITDENILAIINAM